MFVKLSAGGGALAGDGAIAGAEFWGEDGGVEADVLDVAGGGAAKLVGGFVGTDGEEAKRFFGDCELPSGCLPVGD